MGAFDITPALEKSIRKNYQSAGIKEEYTLPEPLNRGYVLSVEMKTQAKCF